MPSSFVKRVKITKLFYNLFFFPFIWVVVNVFPSSQKNSPVVFFVLILTLGASMKKEITFSLIFFFSPSQILKPAFCPFSSIPYLIIITIMIIILWF